MIDFAEMERHDGPTDVSCKRIGAVSVKEAN
jgi:hypothetical protein